MGAMSETNQKFLFSAIELKNDSPRCPQALCAEDTQTKEDIGRG